MPITDVSAKCDPKIIQNRSGWVGLIQIDMPIASNTRSSVVTLTMIWMLKWQGLTMII